MVRAMVKALKEYCGVEWFLDGFGGPAAGAHLDSVDPGGLIAAALPVSRVIGGTVHLSASSPAPGVVRWRAGNGLIIG